MQNCHPKHALLKMELALYVKKKQEKIFASDLQLLKHVLQGHVITTYIAGNADLGFTILNFLWAQVTRPNCVF